MKAIENYRKKLVDIIPDQFPHGHVAAASALGVFLLAITLFPSEEADAKRHSQTIEIPTEAFSQQGKIDEAFLRSAPIDRPRYFNVKTEQIRSGDTLSSIFKRVGLTDRHMITLLNGHQEAKTLASLYPGHELRFLIDDDNELQRIDYIRNQLESFGFERTDSGYKYETHIRVPDTHHASVSGSINNSLYDAGTKARLDDKLIMEMADIFGWDVDFALDIRKGDSFKIVYEEKFLDGEKIGNGNIVAAEFTNQGEVFQAVRYEHKNGDISYYTPEGKSMRKAFLRAPVDFRRISSNFNPKRLHPVFKTVRPHRGIDYAAPTGTPVWSSGNGRVIASGFTKANGNYIVIQHGNNIQTKYLHLHKRFVKKGQKVKQKQKIGSVGSTGYSTGPHLHYEFLISGVHRNPRTILNKLPKAKSISDEEMAHFKAQTTNLVAELGLESAPTKLALSPSHP